MPRRYKYPIVDGKKECSNCHETKPLDSFRHLPDKRVKKGYTIQSTCRQCDSKRRMGVGTGKIDNWNFGSGAQDGSLTATGQMDEKAMARRREYYESIGELERWGRGGSRS